MKILEAIRAAFKRQQNEAVASYDAMVDAVVQGKEVDAEAAIVILREAGKSAEEFAADVERFKSRIAWRLEVDEGEAARPVVTDCNRRLAEIEAAYLQRLEELKGDRDRELEAVGAEKRLAARKVQRGEAAAAELKRTADPALLSDLKAAVTGKPVPPAEGEIAQRRTTADARQKALEVAAQRLANNPHSQQAQADLREAQRAAAEATRELERIEELAESQGAALKSRKEYIADLKQQVLVP